MTHPTHERARIEILWSITQFCLTSVYMSDGERRNFPGLHGFFRDDENAQVGDLIVLQSTPVTKFYLGWLKEIDRSADSRFSTRYLVESVDDGALCWWHNVGISYFDREELASYPQWKWNDRQFTFNDRWHRVCRKEKDAYMVLPTYPIFGNGYEVTLGTRERWGGMTNEPVTPTRHFPDYRKVTKAMMGDCYDELKAETDAIYAARKAEAAA